MQQAEGHGIVILEPGPNYRGFQYFKRKKMLCDWNNFSPEKDFKKLEATIKSRYSHNKYHFIRINSRKPKLIKNIKNMCLTNGWICDHHNQQNKIKNLEELIQKPPERHHFIMIKEYFRASKRLKLNKNIGLILEPSSQVKDVTVTAQGLIPRWWQYYTEGELDFGDEPPLFILSMECVEIYLKFIETWDYKGTNYQSRRLKKNGKPKPNKATWAYNLFPNKRERTAKNSSVDYKFEDGYNNPDEVPPNKWHLNTEDPTKLRGVKTQFHRDANGNWCHVDQVKLIFGERAAGGVSTRRRVLCYHPSQSKYMLRWTLPKENSVETNTDS